MPIYISGCGCLLQVDNRAGLIWHVKNSMLSYLTISFLNYSGYDWITTRCKKAPPLQAGLWAISYLDFHQGRA